MECGKSLSNAPSRETQVNEQMMVMDNRLGILFGQMEILEKRLTTVCRQETKKDTSQVEPIQSLVPLADGLRGMNNRIDLMIGYVTSITDRLEL